MLTHTHVSTTLVLVLSLHAKIECYMVLDPYSNLFLLTFMSIIF